MRILPTNYVETLERWLKLPEGGRIRTEELDVAIWSLLEEVREQDESLRTIHSHNHEIIIGLQRENERLTDELREMARLHNTLEARIDAALVFEGEVHSLILNDGRSYERNHDWHNDAVKVMKGMVKALRGKP